MNKQLIPFTDKIEATWGEEIPDWVILLAELADRSGLKGAGERINYSTTAVSYVLSNKYTGNMDSVEQAVKGALMGLTVNCPAQGEIGRHVCLKWQSLPYGPSDSTRVRVYRACRNGCPHSRLKQRSRV